MFRRLYIALILITLFSAISACSFGGGASSIQVQLSTSCRSATGQDTTCTATLSNSSSSTGNFDWTASSSPSGAQFNPSSGSVAPGASSDQIQVTVPSGICPFTLTFADSNGTSVSNDQTSCWWRTANTSHLIGLCKCVVGYKIREQGFVPYTLLVHLTHEAKHSTRILPGSEIGGSTMAQQIVVDADQLAALYHLGTPTALVFRTDDPSSQDSLLMLVSTLFPHWSTATSV